MTWGREPAAPLPALCGSLCQAPARVGLRCAAQHTDMPLLSPSQVPRTRTRAGYLAAAEPAAPPTPTPHPPSPPPVIRGGLLFVHCACNAAYLASDARPRVVAGAGGGKAGDSATS